MSKQEHAAAALDRLDAAAQALAQVKPPRDPRLAASADNARREHERSVQRALDDLVESLRNRAVPVVLVGRPDQQDRFATALRAKEGCTVVSADAFYVELAREVAVKSGVATYDHSRDVLTPVGLGRRIQFTPDMLAWIQSVTCPRLCSTEGSHYARQEALASTLLNPQPLGGNDVYFEDLRGLVSLVKRQYRTTNLSEQMGKVAVLDALRRVVGHRRTHFGPDADPPVVVIRDAETPQEAAHLASLFASSATILVEWPEKKLDHKFVSETISNARTK